MTTQNPRDLYNAIAETYRANRGKASNDVTELPAMLAVVGDVAGTRLLDLGCGLGTHAKRYLDGGAEVHGIDASEKMVAICEEACGGRGAFSRQEMETADFPPGSFDIVTASYSLMYVEDLEQVLSNVARWLKPGSMFAFSLWHPMQYLLRDPAFDASTAALVTVRLSSYQVEVFNFYRPLERYVDALRGSGFEILKLVEACAPRSVPGLPDEKYRIPSAVVLKARRP